MAVLGFSAFARPSHLFGPVHASGQRVLTRPCRPRPAGAQWPRGGGPDLGPARRARGTRVWNPGSHGRLRDATRRGRPGQAGPQGGLANLPAETQVTGASPVQPQEEPLGRGQRGAQALRSVVELGTKSAGHGPVCAPAGSSSAAHRFPRFCRYRGYPLCLLRKGQASHSGPQCRVRPPLWHGRRHHPGGQDLPRQRVLLRPSVVKGLVSNSQSVVNQHVHKINIRELLEK